MTSKLCWIKLIPYFKAYLRHYFYSCLVSWGILYCPLQYDIITYFPPITQKLGATEKNRLQIWSQSQKYTTKIFIGLLKQYTITKFDNSKNKNYFTLLGSKVIQEF